VLDERSLTELEQAYARLMKEAKNTLSPNQTLAVAAELLDTSHTLGRQEGLQQVLDLLNRVDRSALDPLARVQTDFCLGDAWGELAALARRQGETAVFWETEQTANA
jgi:hypothetical protein